MAEFGQVRILTIESYPQVIENMAKESTDSQTEVGIVLRIRVP